MGLDTPRHLDSPDFRFLADVAARLAAGTAADDGTLDAVAWLARVADPNRAERLRPRAGEPAVLVERLTVHLLRRVPPEAVMHAHHMLDGAGDREPVAVAATAPAAR